MNMKKALIKSPLAPLMAKASYVSERVDEAIYGMLVEASDNAENGFYKVKTHYGYEGFINSKDLLFCSNRIKRFLQGINMRVVIQSTADVLCEPKIRSVVIISLPIGSRVELAETIENGWCSVYLCDGRCGYMKEEFLTELKETYNLINEEVLRESILSTARLYLGVQYRWGGKTSWGIDCSGLCSMSYMLNGIIIYRDSKLVDGYPVHKIEYEKLKKSDLIYSKGHIMIYAGDGKIIHSSAIHGKVLYGEIPPKENIICCGSIFNK